MEVKTYLVQLLVLACLCSSASRFEPDLAPGLFNFFFMLNSTDQEISTRLLITTKMRKNKLGLFLLSNSDVAFVMHMNV